MARGEHRDAGNKSAGGRSFEFRPLLDEKLDQFRVPFEKLKIGDHRGADFLDLVRHAPPGGFNMLMHPEHPCSTAERNSFSLLGK